MRILATILAFASFALAQDTRTATLVGTVTDNTGAAVPKATINVTNAQTQVVSKSETNAEGNYYIPFLNIGGYEVVVEAAGFKKLIRSGIILQAGVTTRIDVQMEIGALNQQVEVTAASPLLATDTAIVGGLDNAKKVLETPMLQSKPQHLLYYMQGSQGLVSQSKDARPAISVDERRRAENRGGACGLKSPPTSPCGCTSSEGVDG
jgi:hypothetical protein